MRTRVSVLALLLVAAAPSVAAATPLSELAESIEPGEWAQLSTDDLLPTIAEQNGGATFSIFPYAEDGVWDPTTGQFFFIGSDHIYDGTSSGARFIAYGDATNAWRVIEDPVSWAGAGTMHGYDHAAILDGGLYQMSLVVDQPTYRWDTATETWEERAPLGDTGYNRFGGLEPFPEAGGLIYAEAGSVYAYDDAQDSWTTVATGVAMGDYHNFAEYNPVHGVVLFGGGNGSGALHAIDADMQIVDYEDAPFQLRVNDAIVTVDPNSGDYLLLGGDGQFLAFDVETEQMLEQPGEVPWFGGSDGPVALTIAGPISSYGVVMFVKHFGVGLDGSAEVWIYRHAPGQGEPPGEPPGGDDDGGSSTTDEPGDGSSEAGSEDDGDAESGPNPPGTSGPDTGDDTDGPAQTSGSADAPSDDDASGCACTTNRSRGSWLFGAVLVLAWRRRRKPLAQPGPADVHD